MKIEGRNSVYELLKTDKEIDKAIAELNEKDKDNSNNFQYINDAIFSRFDIDFC